MNRKISKAFSLFAASLTASVVIAPAIVAETPLEADINKLIAKYGVDSVARKIQEKNPGAAARAAATPVPADAFAPVQQEKETPGLRVFKGQPFGILIRRSYSDATNAEDPTLSDPRASYEQANPAIFAYSYDYLTHATQWSAIGALITPFPLFHNTGPAAQEGMALQDLEFIPSVTLNRVTNNKDKTREADELIFRAGLFAKWVGAFGPLRSLKLSGYATYATNSRGEDGIVAGEVDVEPITSLPGNRTFYRIGEGESDVKDKKRSESWIEYRWRLYLHTEFGGHAGSAFAGGANGKDDNFFRLGPVVQLNLDPFILQRMNASVSYSYLAGITGNPGSSHHFLATLGYILDRDPETQHWSLNASYEDGDTPLVEERVRTFLLSLGVKY